MGNEQEKKAIDMDHFLDVQIGVKESMFNITKTLDDMKDWEELLNLKEESIEDIIIKKTKIIKPKYSSFTFIFIFFGFVFCIIQLIYVQASIIILNSLFKEINDEFKLWLNKTPRELNFYEILERNTYRELPEIDVVMITSSVGIICLKNFGFICCHLTFQLSSLIWLLLLFLLFDFHTDVQLLENYTRLEILVLVLSYVFLSILVGISSTIAIKEYSDIYYDVYNKTANQENGEKLLFYIFSTISAFIIMLINRKIFTSFKNKTSKLILKWIVIICFSSFGLCIVFYLLYLIPITTKKNKKKMQEKKNTEIRKDEITTTNKIENENKKDNNSQTNKNENEIEVITINKFDTKKKKLKKGKPIKMIENEDINNNQKNKILNEREEIKDENSLIITNKSENEDKTISKQLDYELKINKINHSFPQNKEKIEMIRENKIKNKNKNEIYSTKICTICGYIYLKRENTKKSACFCYYYTNKCTWFKEKICNIDVLFPFFFEFILQICIMGFNPILTEKLLNDFSYSKNIKFYCALFIISLFFGIFIVYIFGIDLVKPNEIYKSFSLCGVSFIFFCGFIIFTFISSVCYFTDDNLKRERWNNIIMAEFIYFKVIDFQILSFFDFLDNSDIFNTTLVITFEKLLWMIIETIIDTYVKNTRKLILIQIIVTSFNLGVFLFIIIYAILK